MRTCGGGIAV